MEFPLSPQPDFMLTTFSPPPSRLLARFMFAKWKACSPSTDNDFVVLEESLKGPKGLLRCPNSKESEIRQRKPWRCIVATYILK